MPRFRWAKIDTDIFTSWDGYCYISQAVSNIIMCSLPSSYFHAHLMLNLSRP